MLEELRDIAFRFQIDPKQSIGHAARLESVITVLKGIQESYNNYLRIEFLHNDEFAKAYETNSKVFDTVREDLELLIVDLNYGSFEAAIAPNLTPSATLFTDKVKEWKSEVYATYRDEVLNADFEDPDYFNAILQRYSDTERSKIFKPLFNIASSDQPYRVNITRKKGEPKRVLRPPVKGLYDLYVPKTERQEIAKPTNIVQVYARMEKDENGEYRFTRQTMKEVVYFEELPHETYPFKPDVINFDETTYVLTQRLTCSVSFEDGQYIIHNEPLDITVWGETREEAEKAFAFAFHATYANYVEEDDDLLSEDAQRLKQTLFQLVKIRK